MASSASKWIVFLLISSAIFFIAVVFKVYMIPVISEVSTSHLPLLCRSVLGWLEPPYLYLVVNGIIIIIAASSKFQLHHQNRPLVLPPAGLPAVEPATVYPAGRAVDEVIDDKCVVAEDGGCWATGGGDGDHGAGQKFKVSWKIPVTELTEILPESLSPNMKPPASTRFVHRRSASGSSKGGTALEKRGSRWHGSMEDTWKEITGGQKMTRHLSKRDTWQDQEPQIILPGFRPSPPTAAPPRSVKKLETLKDRELQPPPLVRREPSLSQDELNHRVEAFIEKFNEEMRLQRQRSLDQLKEMMEGGL